MQLLNQIIKKNNNINLLFLIITFSGLILRLYFIFSRDVFTDEVFYLNVAIQNSFKDIFFLNIWLKDHAFLYLVLLKILSFLTSDIFLLRLSSVVFYIIISVILFKFFSKFSKPMASLTIFLFSFYSYFAYLNSQISPYNLSLFFSVLSIVFLLEKKFFASSIFAILAFYSDYSSFYYFLFFILFFLWVFLTDTEQILLLLNSLLLIIIFILPQIKYLLFNWNDILHLNNYNFSEFRNFKFLTLFLNTIFLRQNEWFSLIIAAALLLILYLTIIKNRNKKREIGILFLFLISFIIGLLSLYFISDRLIYIYSERSFWFFYLELTIILSTLFNLIKRIEQKIIYLVLIGFIIVARFFPNDNFTFPGIVPNLNYHYQDLVQELNNVGPDKIIYIDKRYNYTPLKEYYLRNIKNQVVIRSQFTVTKQFRIKEHFLLDEENLTNRTVVVNFNDNFFSSKVNSRISVYQKKCIKSECRFYKLKY